MTRSPVRRGWCTSGDLFFHFNVDLETRYSSVVMHFVFRIQQRNGRKTLTTVQVRLPSSWHPDDIGLDIFKLLIDIMAGKQGGWQ